MKVLWISDAGVQTGFGRATHGIADRLVTQHGHEVSILAINYRGDHYETPCHLYVPTLLDQKDIFGFSRVLEILAKVEPDVVVLLNDPFIINRYLFRNEAFDPNNILLKYRPLVTYQPRDGYNPPATWDTLREIKVKDKTIPVSRQVAMSKFGQEQMPGSDLVYHGINAKVFRPASNEDPLFTSQGHRITNKREAKDAFGYPTDGFLVGRVDANSLRKDYASTWKALVPVMHKHSDIMVHFHCSGSDIKAGVSMPALWTRDMETAPRFRLADRMDSFDNWAIEDLVVLFNAFDVFVSTSQGEGFGFGLAESLACAVPVIAQNITAIPEVVGPGGILIEPGFAVTAPGGQDMWAADVPAFSEAIETLYRDHKQRKLLGVLGMEHVRANFQWDVEAAKMNTILQDVAGIYERVEATA